MELLGNVATIVMLVGFPLALWGLRLTWSAAKQAGRDAAEADRILRLIVKMLHTGGVAQATFDKEGRVIDLEIIGYGDAVLPLVKAAGTGTSSPPPAQGDSVG